MSKIIDSAVKGDHVERYTLSVIIMLLNSVILTIIKCTPRALIVATMLPKIQWSSQCNFVTYDFAIGCAHHIPKQRTRLLIPFVKRSLIRKPLLRSWIIAWLYTVVQACW